MLIIQGADIDTITNGVIKSGDILVNNGRIEKIGTGLPFPAGTKVISGKGLNVLPGFIDCHTHIGLQEKNAFTALGNISETTNPVTPDVDVLYGVDVTAKAFAKSLENGVTTVGIIPGSSNIVNGIGFATKTYGDHIFDMCIRHPIGLKIALGENPKGLYNGRNLAPTSRMGIAPLFRKYLYEAKKYMQEKEDAEKRDVKFSKKQEYEVAIPVFRGEIPLRIHCTHNDMTTAIAIAQEFEVKFTLEHAWGADNYLDELASSVSGIVYGPIGGKRSFYESRRTDIGTVAVLDKMGVRVALTTDSPILSLATLLNMAEETVRQGTPWDRALRMVTINPAEILGVQNRVGSIEEGKDADLVLYNGMPTVDMSASVVCTIVNGSVVYQK